MTVLMNCYKVIHLVYEVHWQLCVSVMESGLVGVNKSPADFAFSFVSIVRVWSIHEVFEIVERIFAHSYG